jgi:hypothetical protein
MSNRRLRHVVITSAGTVTSPVLPTLGELSLSASSFTLSATSTANIIGTTTGSSLTATGLPAGLTLDSAARTLSWNGVGTLGSSSFLLTESLVVSGTTITRQTTINYSITVTLVALSLSSTSFVNGTSSSGTIIGAKTGSTISGSGLPTGFTINSAARTWAFDGTGGISTGTLTLIETLTGATNTPLPTLINYTISAPATITTPVLTQTSTAGSAPFLFDAVFNLANTFAGYTFRVQTASGTGGDFTSPTQDILHTLTESEITSGSVDISSDGFLSPSGGFSLRARIERDDGVTSAWSNTLTDTIVSSVAKWTPTTGNKKNSGVNVTGGNLTATGVLGRGSFGTVAATIATAQTKFQFSFTVVAGPDANQNLVGLYDETAITNVSAVAPGWNTAGIGLNFNVGSTALGFFANSGGAAQTTTLGSAVAVGDEFTIEADISGSAGSHVIKAYRGSSNTPVLTWTGLTLTGFKTAYFSVKDGVGVTANFGASTFTHPLNSGFNFYG